MSELRDVMARMRGALLAIEMGLKALGEGAHNAADQLADKVREFAGADEQGKGGDDAAKR